MKTKEFANKFGVSVEEMCGITELSRQGLNDIVTGKSPKPSKAKRIALYNLRDYAAISRAQDIKKANEPFEIRDDFGVLYKTSHISNCPYCGRFLTENYS